MSSARTLEARRSNFWWHGVVIVCMVHPVFKIMLGATLALVIPFLGNRFVEGWHWTWHDFVFAWVFWVVAALTILLVTSRRTTNRAAISVVIFLLFAALWVMLATG